MNNYEDENVLEENYENQKKFNYTIPQRGRGRPRLTAPVQLQERKERSLKYQQAYREKKKQYNDLYVIMNDKQTELINRQKLFLQVSCEILLGKTLEEDEKNAEGILSIITNILKN